MEQSTGANEHQRALRKVRLKLDLLLIPVLTIAYGLQFYDKAVLGSASVFGVIEDLGLSRRLPSGAVSTVRYSTATAAFYWGYIIGVLPISLLLQRIPIAKGAAAFVFVWGIIVILTPTITSYEGLVVNRVFLGLTESAVSPAFVAISTMYYTKAELSSRLGAWYSATGIFSMFSGVVNYGLGHADSGIATWKVLFLFAGAITICFSAVLLVLVPDSIDTAKRWFNEDERALLKERVVTEPQGAEDKTLRLEQLKEAARDPLVYVYMITGALIYLCNGGVTAFGARIIRTFGYTSLQAILLQIPGGATTVLAIAICCYLDSRRKNITTILLAVSCLPIIVGSVILWKASWRHRGWPLFGYWLLPIFGAPYVMLLSLAARNTQGGAKKSVVNGAIFVGYCAGNIAAPYSVLTPEAAIHYRTTWITLISAMCVTIAIAIALRFYFIWENRRRDGLPARNEAATRVVTEKSEESPVQEQRFLTDRTDLSFRYSY